MNGRTARLIRKVSGNNRAKKRQWNTLNGKERAKDRRRLGRMLMRAGLAPTRKANLQTER